MAQTGPAEPGLWLSKSKIKAPHLLNEDDFFKWYDGIWPSNNQVLQTRGGIQCVSYNEEAPYLTLSPLPNVGSVGVEQYKTVAAELNGPDSATAPVPSHHLFDLLDFDARWYKLTGFLDPYGDKFKGDATKSIVLAGLDVRQNLTEKDLAKYYEILEPMLVGVEGFIRQSRFKLVSDWWSGGHGWARNCPDFLEVVEFSTDKDSVDLTEMMVKSITPEVEKYLEDLSIDFTVYDVRKQMADGWFPTETWKQ